MLIDEFKEELVKLNIDVDKEKLEKLEAYYNLLIEYNKVMNLTAITKKEDVYLKHFYDSLTISKAISLKENINICDFGTGAGFPGLVLKIVFPNLKVTLVDSLNKRVEFLKTVIEKLDLKDIVVYHARMEEFSKEHEEEYDLITARAVSHISNLLEYSVASVKINGSLVFMKGDATIEITEAKNAFDKLNVCLKEQIEFNLPKENSKRTLVVCVKKDKTPNKYPRKYAEIKKNRL